MKVTTETTGIINSLYGAFLNVPESASNHDKMLCIAGHAALNGWDVRMAGGNLYCEFDDNNQTAEAVISVVDGVLTFEHFE